MRQRGDLEFISFLKKIWVGTVDYEGEKILLSRSIAKDNPAYPRHALHMCAENKPSVDYRDVISINAIDEVSQEIQLSDKKTETIRARNIGDTGNLASDLNLKVGIQVILTINIDLKDRLVNGLVGKVMYLKEHWCRFENLPTSSSSHEKNMSKISQ